jgi:hypothetical protein
MEWIYLAKTGRGEDVALEVPIDRPPVCTWRLPSLRKRIERELGKCQYIPSVPLTMLSKIAVFCSKRKSAL